VFAAGALPTSPPGLWAVWESRGRVGSCGAERSWAAISKSLWERWAEPSGRGVRSEAEWEAPSTVSTGAAPSTGHRI